jgi:hypothetical protein
VAFALREKPGHSFTTGYGQKPRERTVAARQQACMLREVAQAKRRFGLPDTAPVVRRYEAGRAGFWRHRFLHAQGLTNREPARALDGDGVGREWGVVSTCECHESLVEGVSWWRWKALEAHRDYGGGTEVTHGASSGPGYSLRGQNSKRCKWCCTAASSLGLGAGGDSPLNFRAHAEAVEEMGSPPTGLPALVERRREHRVTDVWVRTERRSLETMDANAIGKLRPNEGDGGVLSTFSVARSSSAQHGVA